MYLLYIDIASSIEDCYANLDDTFDRYFVNGKFQSIVILELSFESVIRKFRNLPEEDDTKRKGKSEKSSLGSLEQALTK